MTAVARYMANRYVHPLRTRQPHGPCLIRVPEPRVWAHHWAVIFLVPSRAAWHAFRCSIGRSLSFDSRAPQRRSMSTAHLSGHGLLLAGTFKARMPPAALISAIRLICAAAAAAKGQRSHAGRSMLLAGAPCRPAVPSGRPETLTTRDGAAMCALSAPIHLGSRRRIGMRFALLPASFSLALCPMQG